MYTVMMLIVDHWVPDTWCGERDGGCVTLVWWHSPRARPLQTHQQLHTRHPRTLRLRQGQGTLGFLISIKFKNFHSQMLTHKMLYLEMKQPNR